MAFIIRRLSEVEEKFGGGVLWKAGGQPQIFRHLLYESKKALLQIRI